MGGILTGKQKLVLKTIRDFFLNTGYAPSLGELQRMLDISTKRGVVNHLEVLEKKGYIIRTSEPRGIQLVEGNTNDDIVYEYLIGIPIFGYANAGTPLVSAEEENLGILKIQKDLVGSKQNLFSLIVKGDSMNEEVIGERKISDGSYLIIQKDTDVINGDVVVAIIDNCATVKKFKRDNDLVILYPNSDNPKHQPIYLDSSSESLINGKVIKVLENPSI